MSCDVFWQYGGDVTRRNKLLDNQKAGKKKMRNIGRVVVPKDIFINVLRRWCWLLLVLYVDNKEFS